MRKLAANSPVAPIKSSAIRGYARSNLTVSWKIEGYISAWWMLNIFIDSKSQLVKAFETFLEFAFAATPPATEFQSSRQFVAPDHAFCPSRRHSQQLAGLRASRETQPFRISSLRRHPVGNANAITLRGTAALSDGKAAALQFSLGVQNPT
jgi:hypothetical protein